MFLFAILLLTVQTVNSVRTFQGDFNQQQPQPYTNFNHYYPNRYNNEYGNIRNPYLTNADDRNFYVNGGQAIGNTNQQTVVFPGQTGNVASKPITYEESVIQFPVRATVPKIQLSPNCTFADRKALYQDKCEELMVRGPCAENQWLLLSQNGIPECQNRPCVWGSVLHNGICVSLKDSVVCPINQILYVDLFGTAECDCEEYYRYHFRTGTCFSEHEQGFCGYSQYIVFHNNNMICSHNPCVSDEFLFIEGTCHKKNYVGYCDPKVISIARDSSADCSNAEGFSIFNVPTFRSCSSGSRAGYFGSCRRIFRVPTVRTRPRSIGGCSSGFRGSGSRCRSVLNLFGSKK